MEESYFVYVIVILNLGASGELNASREWATVRSKKEEHGTSQKVLWNLPLRTQERRKVKNKLESASFS